MNSPGFFDEWTHLAEDEGGNIRGLPKTGVEEMWKSGHGKGVEDLRTVQDVVHSLVTPPPTGHYKVKVKLYTTKQTKSNSAAINIYKTAMLTDKKEKFHTEVLLT